MQAHLTLVKLRKAAGITQAEAAAYLTSRGCLVAPHAYSKWDRGITKPNMEQFLYLMELYGVHDVLGSFGLGKAGKLNDRGRERLNEYAGLLARDERFCAREDARRVSRVLPLYDLPVSAGTGQFLDGEQYELIEVAEHAPEKADFAVRIKGDSMLPRYHDGQIVFAEKRDSIEKGEIGVFVLNGEAFCKKLGGETETELVSLNPAYAPIRVLEGDALAVMGRVL